MKCSLSSISLLLFSLFFLACKTEKDYVVTIKTNYGDMTAILYEETPKHKENFIKLVEEGFYDSLLFHRVIKDFMIQGGDPDSKGAAPAVTLGNGGPGYTIPAEFNDRFFHEKGALSAARLGDHANPKKESSGSQFYIVQGKKFSEEELTTDLNQLGAAVQQLAQGDSLLLQELMELYRSRDQQAYIDKLLSLKPTIKEKLHIDTDKKIDPAKLKAYTTQGGAMHLDGGYTVFGKVVEGLEVIDKIAGQPTKSDDRPVKDVIMQMELKEMPKAKITELYGYEYPEEEK